MLILRIKRCEHALGGGRLDEAFELLRAADLRAHRQGQAIADQLLAALVTRGRDHLAAGRLSAAAEDARKALSVGGNHGEVVQLRAAIDRAAAQEREELTRRERAAAAARRLVEEGALTLGGERAARAADRGDAAAGLLVDDIAARRVRFDRFIADATAAMARDDWESAVQHLSRARVLRPGAGQVQEMLSELGHQVTAEAQRMVDAGRLDAAGALLRRVGSLVRSQGELAEIRRGLDQCQEAWDCVREGRCAEATEMLSRLRHVWPRAEWLSECVACLSRAGDAVRVVRSGPLGLLTLSETLPGPRHDAVRPAPIGANVPGDMRRFILHVDGAGTYLVLQGDSIDVGPVSASRQPDLPLLTAADSPVVTLSRSDEDYFLNARVPVPINGRMAASKLLANGDRIGVGPRCRIEFRRPNPASGSAVLHITGARLPWGGVRELLLMHRELVIGPTAAAHIRTRGGAAGAGGAEQVILHSTGGQLICRAGGAVIAVDGRPMGTTAELTPGGRVVAGDLSLVVQPA